ncbi:MAG: hypothetical protein K1X75_16280 [Leptospirales bacterium]|nr:hypothetical protein [Leptospirales bacterium]
MSLVNRDVLILYPKQALYDWANRIFAENENYGPVDLTRHESGTVFLIEELDSPEHFDRWIQENYEFFFMRMVEEWTPEESLWPKEVSFPMFQDWFHAVYHSMVIDVEEAPLEREDE